MMVRVGLVGGLGVCQGMFSESLNVGLTPLINQPTNTVKGLRPSMSGDINW